MITRTDISEFFNLEAEASKNSWEALINLPIKDRIRKRKAIDNVYLKRFDFPERNEENKIKLSISFEKNLSDFKEGDAVVLHDGSPAFGIKSTIYSIVDDNTIVLEVYPPNLPVPYDGYFDKPLQLDKDCVDLRENVFYKFLAELSHDAKFWEDLIINNPHTPTFEEIEKCSEELDDTCTNFKLNLLPNQRDAILKSMASKDYYLVQGPPGTGKSFVLSVIILEEIAYFNHKVIVIGPNHMAINNTLEQALKLAPPYSQVFFKVGQSYNAPSYISTYEGKEYKIENNFRIDSTKANTANFPWLIGLTPHCLYTSRAEYLKCDTLIIDEAGQMTIPLVLMGIIKAKKVIFAGDHKQLPPIISSEDISEEMKQSAFQALMTKDNCTMLDVSFRMCEPICNFVSDLFYEGKVKPMKVGCGDMIVSNEPLLDFHTPIVIHHVDDNGEQTSDKEALFISETIAGFLKKGLPADEIAVLSPFRAQAANVRRHIRKNPNISEEQRKLVVADTIDKMQGQEREVIVFSLVAGDPDYMTDMAEFLYNPNKLNVAFSRAKSKLIIVGNIEQLRKISSIEYPHIDKMLESKYVTMV